MSVPLSSGFGEVFLGSITNACMVLGGVVVIVLLAASSFLKEYLL